MKSAKSQSGVALIAVLWVIAFLVTIASTVAHQSRSSLQMTKNRIETLKLKQAAESAILLSIAEKINFPGGREISLSDHVFNSNYKDINIRLSISDESGKIDLNTAPLPILTGLMLEVGVEEDQADSIANAILDWRDEDNLVRVNGAEDNEYLSSGYAYGSKDAYFERIEELQLVYGVSKQLYIALQPYITVYTHDFGVNTIVASALVKRVVNNAIASSTLDTEDFVSEDFDEEDSEGLDEFTSLTEGYVYTFEVLATNRSGMNQKLSATIRLDRGNTYEPFTVLSWN